jgi:hypothetical protein
MPEHDLTTVPDASLATVSKQFVDQPPNPQSNLDLDEGALLPEDVNFAKEDIVLYTFCGLLLIFLGSFFWISQARLENSLLEDQTLKVQAGNRAKGSVEGLDLYGSYLQTQQNISAQRYSYGARILLTNSTRKNTGFMVGTMIGLLGCIMVIRRVRKMPITADFEAAAQARLRVVTGSPGLFVTLLGSLIILCTIIRYDSFDLQDPVIQPPGSFSVVANPGPSPNESPKPPENASPAPGAGKVLTPEEQAKLKELLEKNKTELSGGK